MATAVEFKERKGSDREAGDVKPKSANVRRLSINLPLRTFQVLLNLAEETGRSLTEMVRIGVALSQVAIEEEAHGRKLAVIDREGRVVKEIVPHR